MAKAYQDGHIKVRMTTKGQEGHDTQIRSFMWLSIYLSIPETVKQSHFQNTVPQLSQTKFLLLWIEKNVHRGTLVKERTNPAAYPTPPHL